MELTVTNPGQAPFILDAACDSVVRPVDAHRCSEFRFTTARSDPVQPSAWIKLKDCGRVLFRGYVFSFKVEGDKKSVYCRGEEELLMHRYTPRHGYQNVGDSGDPTSMRLCHVFESDEPNQVPDRYGVVHNSGLIFLANSALPGLRWLSEAPVCPGCTPLSAFVHKLSGWGTKSRIGEHDIYFEGIRCTPAPTYSYCTGKGNSYYRDSDDMYIHAGDQYSDQIRLYPGHSHVSAANAFDTHIRKGIINKDDTQLALPLQVCKHRYADILINVANQHKLTPHWRYENDYTFFDAFDEA